MQDADDADEDGWGYVTTPVPQKELRNLAYSAPTRNGGRGGFYSFKLFVEVKGPNPLKVKRWNEVDDNEMLKYRGSNDLRNIKAKERIYCTLSVSDFVRIKGVTWLPETGNDGRTCWTYVWVEIRNISDHEPIMNRIIPPWSPEARKDLLHSDSLKLVHALPKKKRKDQVVLRRRGDSDDDDDDYDDGDYSLARRTRSRRDPEMEALAGVIKDLRITIGNTQEQSRIQMENMQEQQRI
ncbi:hypothetical protein QBC46DRAFT_454418 [Diplogelasinospora grovesii]|uniref:Uncharacterized protein n=1 Tax=Diplogelasinospora grovesii TaxID=303347 RepID=A0AAN6MXL0_9PEZI|nr:hypothetical protein QBC46DRAFT_454418 [Diplogelasinospora grovesii]